MDIKLPELGEGASSGTVVAILVKEGDTIEKDQSIIELENEKAVAPIPSSAKGRVEKIHVSEGDEISVGDVIVSIAQAEDRGAEKADGKEERRQRKAEAERRETGNGRDREGGEDAGNGTESRDSERTGSPTVRTIARQLGIDLAKISPRRLGDRVTVEDLRDYVQGLIQAASAGVHVTREAAKPVDFSQWGPIYKRPMTSTRRAISKAMSRVNTEVPQVTQFGEADVTDLLTAIDEWSEAYKRQGKRLTLTVALLGALVPVLKSHPVFNASLDAGENEIVFKEYYHFGIAVDTPRGLLVPVIRDVDRKTPALLAEELGTLATRARQSELSLKEMRGGTFTISNQGGIGGSHFTPLLNWPETAILGVGRASKRPSVAEDGEIAPCTLLPLSLSYDHRVIDGADAARFMVQLCQGLERYDAKTLELAESS